MTRGNLKEYNDKGVEGTMYEKPTVAIESNTKWQQAEELLQILGSYQHRLKQILSESVFCLEITDASDFGRLWLSRKTQG